MQPRAYIAIVGAKASNKLPVLCISRLYLCCACLCLCCAANGYVTYGHGLVCLRHWHVVQWYSAYAASQCVAYAASQSDAYAASQCVAYAASQCVAYAASQSVASAAIGLLPLLAGQGDTRHKSVSAPQRIWCTLPVTPLPLLPFERCPFSLLHPCLCCLLSAAHSACHIPAFAAI